MKTHRIVVILRDQKSRPAVLKDGEVVLDGRPRAVADVLWLDGDTRARSAAQAAGYSLLEISHWEAYRVAVGASVRSAGGRARAKGMTREQRIASATKAVTARWAKVK